MVRGNATEYRLGPRVARLCSTTSGSEDTKCPQSAVRIANQESPTPPKNDETAHSSGLRFIPRETPDDGIKASQAVHAPKYTTDPGRIQTTPLSVRRGRIPTVPRTENLGSCDRAETRSTIHHSRQDIHPDSNRTKGTSAPRRAPTHHHSSSLKRRTGDYVQYKITERSTNGR